MRTSIRLIDELIWDCGSSGRKVAFCVCLLALFLDSSSGLCVFGGVFCVFWCVSYFVVLVRITVVVFFCAFKSLFTKGYVPETDTRKMYMMTV